MPQPLKVLLVEDNPDDANMVLQELTRAGFETTSQRVDTEAAFLAGLDGGLDLILCDYTMPDFSGLRALELLKKSGLDIPFLIVSGTIGEEIAVEAMKLGAADYLFKDRLARLGPAVHQALEQVRLRRERRKLEAELIEAQKMEVIGQLAGGVAHDFNNLIAVIMGYSDLMMEKLEADSPLQKDAQTIRHAAERAAGLTRQLLVFSRKQTVQPVVLDINQVVGDMEKMLGRLIDENVELIFTLGPQIGRLKADSGYVGQVLMNLVVNARDAMPNGGKITVETGNATLDQDYARAHPGAVPGDYVMLSVSDTGTGMTDEVKAHLFEAFFTTKPKGKGTGLGLATCQTIVQQCGGHIAISSQVGQGATFRVYFPQVQEAIKEADTTFKKKPHAARDGNIAGGGRRAGRAPSGLPGIARPGLHGAVGHQWPGWIACGPATQGGGDQFGHHRCDHATHGRQSHGGVAEIQFSRHQGSLHFRIHRRRPLASGRAGARCGVSAQTLHPRHPHAHSAGVAGRQIRKGSYV